MIHHCFAKTGVLTWLMFDTVLMRIAYDISKFVDW